MILPIISDAFEETRAIPLTQRYLAEMWRLSRTVFAKLVAELEVYGSVQQEYGSLVVLPQWRTQAPERSFAFAISCGAV